MKVGLGLYRHMLTREYYDFARQAGCTHVVIHLVDYFRQGASNPANNQPTGGKYEPWGVAGDPERLWRVDRNQKYSHGNRRCRADARGHRESGPGALARHPFGWPETGAAN